jgi:hypothetical protein
MLKVKDYSKFRYFDYDNETSFSYQLGDVLIKHYDNQESEIGVVIQTFEKDFRTDMWGMSYDSEVAYATISDVEKYRPNIIQELINN